MQTLVSSDEQLKWLRPRCYFLWSTISPLSRVNAEHQVCTTGVLVMMHLAHTSPPLDHRIQGCRNPSCTQQLQPCKKLSWAHCTMQSLSSCLAEQCSHLRSPQSSDAQHGFSRGWVHTRKCCEKYRLPLTAQPRPTPSTASGVLVPGPNPSWVQILTLPLNPWVTLGKSRSKLKSHFPQQ